MNYKKRIADKILKEKLESFGGVLIVGPKRMWQNYNSKILFK